MEQEKRYEENDIDTAKKIEELKKRLIKKEFIATFNAVEKQANENTYKIREEANNISDEIWQKPFSI